MLAVDFIFLTHFPQTTGLAFDFWEGPTTPCGFESRGLTQALISYLIRSLLASYYPPLHYRNVVTTVFPFHCHSSQSHSCPSWWRKAPSHQTSFQIQLSFPFSCPIYCRAVIGCCISSFPFSLKASALHQLGLSLVFHFPIRLLSAIWPPFTCGCPFPCSLHACF